MICFASAPSLAIRPSPVDAMLRFGVPELMLCFASAVVFGCLAAVFGSAFPSCSSVSELILCFASRRRPSLAARRSRDDAMGQFIVLELMLGFVVH